MVDDIGLLEKMVVKTAVFPVQVNDKDNAGTLHLYKGADQPFGESWAADSS